MLDNQTRKKLFNELCRDVGQQFHYLRVEKNKYMLDVAEELNRTIKTIDDIESGKIKNLELNFLVFLAGYYDKRIKIDIVDV